MSEGANPIERILDLARWAPSGDNTQPWRFEVRGPRQLTVHGSDTRAHCVYDLDGRPSQIALGALLETLRIGATALGWQTEVLRRPGLPEHRPTFDVQFHDQPSLPADPLLPQIARRSVNRRPYSTRPISAGEKTALAGALGPGYRLQWLEGWAGRWQAASLMFHNAKIRLTTEEAYWVHRDVIAWGRRFSADRVPDQALGVDGASLKLMRWAMHDWARVQWMNRFAAGTWAPRLQMDWLPSLLCGAHLVLLRDQAAVTLDDHVEAGRVVQRLWLTACALGLQQQPEMTPLIFARYTREGRAFSQNPAAVALAARVTALSRRAIGPGLDNAVWMGRIGQAAPAPSRSVRKSSDALRVGADGQTPPDQK